MYANFINKDELYNKILNKLQLGLEFDSTRMSNKK